MLLIILFALLLLFDGAAFLWGVDSREGFDSPEWRRRQDWLCSRLNNQLRKPDDAKVSSPVCAVRRVVRSLPEAGGMREEIPG
jgi:hypothetical protein